jgi:PmbA protein
VEYQHDKGFGVTVYQGQKKGSASTSDVTPAALLSTVKAACNIAQYTGSDPYSGLADPACLAKNIPDLDLYHPWDISADDAAILAQRYEAAALEADKRITNSEGASVNTYRGVRVYGNSHGFLEGYQTTRHSISCSLIAESQQGMQRDGSYTMGRSAADLWSVERVAKEAAERVVGRLNAKKPKSMHVPVILDSRVSGGLIRSYLSAVSGGNLYRHASFLLNAKGQKIFPDFMNIQDRPYIQKGLGSTPFDHEGVEPQDRYLVRDGVCEGYLLGSYSARKLGLQTTGNSGGSHNVLVSHQDESFEALLKKMDRGVVVTEFLGQGVNLVTGDYSRGACGFWVEHGKIQYALEEMTVAGNLKDMFKRIVAVGSDVETRSSLHCGSILIEEISIAGEST